MTKISKAFITWEEFYQIMGAGWSSSTPVDAANVGGLVPGSIPFADASGYLTEDNPALFWDAAEDNLGIGTNTFGATMTQGIQMKTGLAPTANVVDTFAFYSADFVAGNACPHFRTENGTVIGLNQSLFTTDNVTFGTIGCGTITVANGASINLQEDITFTGATGVNLVKFPDNLADALSFMEGANPYQTFITTNGSEAIQFHEDVLLRGSTEYQATNKTSGAWAKSIGGGGDYADWATMIAAMPDLIAHAVTITIEATTTLTETCDIYNKHGIKSVGVIIVQAEKYYPTAGVIPTGDSATATTLRDAALAAEAYGNDYFNGCWILIVDGTGTDNGFVAITDYVDATGDVVVAAWPGTQPDNTSRYIIVGALIDSAATRGRGLQLFYNTVYIQFIGIGFTDATVFNIESRYNNNVYFLYCGIDKSDLSGILTVGGDEVRFSYCGIIGNNTGNNAAYAGITSLVTNRLFIEGCGISDNNQRGIYLRYGSFGYVSANFGDANGNWGTYCESSGQALITGAECSGAAGNHSDPGTAGNANADQAAAY